MYGCLTARRCGGFSLAGTRTLYRATKLCAELLINEYVAFYNLRAVVNRCGVLAGPGRWGRWIRGGGVVGRAAPFRRPLSYVGFGGTGKQVRDFLHVEDLFELLHLQLRHVDAHSGQVYNVGGGLEGSLSLRELTDFCRQATGKTIPIGSEAETRPGDVRIYLTDTSKVRAAVAWKPAGRWIV